MSLLGTATIYHHIKILTILFQYIDSVMRKTTGGKTHGIQWGINSRLYSRRDVQICNAEGAGLKINIRKIKTMQIDTGNRHCRERSR